MLDKKVIIVGGFHEIIELCEKTDKEIVGIIDNELVNRYLGYPILGKDCDANQIFDKYPNIPVIITPDRPILREKLYNFYRGIGFSFTSLISPKAIIAKSAKIGIGVIIQDGVNISAFTDIGNFVKINSFANLMHDSTIGDFTTLAPNAVVLGRVKIGLNCYIGANSTILPELMVENYTTVGAGAVVTRNTEIESTVIGIPAKKIN